MSRPPRPHHDEPTYASLQVERDRLHMQPWTWQQLIDMQHQLARDELDMVAPGGEGSFTHTLFELSALVAHVLSKYQDHYASEAYLGTASTTRSLIRHGRRLAYTVDPGLAATGTVAFTVPDGLAGELPSGLALSSAPQGQRKPQKYETIAPRKVDARWNAIEPVDARVTRTYAKAELVLVGVGHGLEPGDHVVLAKPDDPGSAQLHRLDTVDEDPEQGTTSVVVVGSLGQTIVDPLNWTVYAGPRRQQPLFGADADPVVFPPAQLADAGDYPKPPDDPDADTPPQYGYLPAGLDPADIFTAARLDQPLVGQWAMIWKDAEYQLAQVVDQRDIEVSFHAWQVIEQTVEVGDVSHTLLTPIERWISASTTALALARPDGTPFTRPDLAPGAVLHHDFERSLALVSERPNEVFHELGAALSLAGQHALEPGMRVVLSDRAGAIVQLVELTSVEHPGDTTTTITYAQVSPPAGLWRLGDLLVLGNVATGSHGSSHTEVLGDSDGVTPHQRFVLRKPRVTQLPGRDGAEPALELKVGEVSWTRVEDFGRSGPTDRHYRVEIDERQQLHVVFGDGRQAAIPARGRRHLVASYRVGLGLEGNLDVGALTRLAQAHPLVASIRNPLSFTGGTEPAGGDAIKREATRWIRTFDRAVSIRDHADLALLYPGVARANASPRLDGGVELVVADATGQPIADTKPLCAFLQARRDVSVPLHIVDPDPVQIRISLELELDPAFNMQAVELAVRAALHGEVADAPGLFTFPARELGQAAHRSEVYAVLQAIAGVVFVNVRQFRLAGSGPSSHDLLVVRPHQWLSLDPTKLTLFTSFSTEEI